MESHLSRSLVSLLNVSKRYDAAAAASPDVLRSINLQLGDGESLAIVGPSGCGKSTLLNLIGALDQPTGGSVAIDGQDLSAMDEPALARLRNERIGWVFQLHHLLPQLTVLENVLAPVLPRGPAGPAALGRARQLLARVGLPGREDSLPGQLSGGERQRVAVVRALINSPRLLLADEPTGSLDHASAEALGGLLAELNGAEGLALIVVTHSLELASLMHRVLELRDGQLASLNGAGKRSAGAST